MPPYAISKYKLAEQLIARGLASAFRAFVDADDAFHLLYHGAQELQSDNAAFVAGFEAFRIHAGVSESDALAVLEAARAGELPTAEDAPEEDQPES